MLVVALQDKSPRLARPLARSLNSRFSPVTRSSRQTTLFGKNWLFTFLSHPTIYRPLYLQTRSSYKPQSSNITCLTKLGHTPFQTWETPEILVALETSWAAMLPVLFKCWKEHQEKKEEISLMFWIMCPYSPPRSQSEIAWIIERALDSTMTWEIPISEASNTPSCNAIASMILAGKGAERILFDAAMRKPRLSRITTPMLEGLPSSKAAPSTLTLKKPKGGAC